MYKKFTEQEIKEHMALDYNANGIGSGHLINI